MVMRRFRAMEECAVEKDLVSNYAPTPSIAQSEDYLALQEADQQGAVLTDAVHQAGNAGVSLEAIAHYLSTAVKDQELGVSTTQFVNIAVESICLEADFDAGQNIFSIESYKQNPQLALEGALDAIGQKIKDIWAFIKAKLVVFFKLLAEKMDYFKRNMGNLERKLKALEGALATTPDDGVPKLKALKPSYWFIDLIYLDKGFPKYAQGVTEDLESLLKAHADLFSKVIAQQIDWLKTNHQAVAENDGVLGSFKVKTNDFLMLDAKPLNRSIRELIPAEGNMFYRSRELPGGMAVFTEIEPHDRTGVLAIDMLSKVKVRIDEFDPVSYDARSLEIAKQVQADLNAWFDSLPDEQRVNTEMPEIDLGIARIQATGRTIAIKRDMVFETLPLAEVKLRLTEVKDTLKSITQWYDVVFGELWKDKDFDYLATTLIESSSVVQFSHNVYVNPAPRHLGNLVLAMLEVMSNATQDTHTYAFKTCGALLNYVEESLNQYP